MGWLGTKDGRLGPYTVEDRLASGGMAEVFVAHREGPHGFKKRVALKRILPELATDPAFVSLFIDEARLAARLDHPHIVQVFDFGEYDGELVLVMELVEGTHLGRLLRAANLRNERLPLDQVLEIMSQAAHALAHAHTFRDEDGKPLGIVHRDVSPSNLLLTGSGFVKLSDFGIARAVTNVVNTGGGQVKGKLGYMSPEQVHAKVLTDRSDVFTLAAVFSELLSGVPLFGGGDDLRVLLRISNVDLSGLEAGGRQLPKDVLSLLQSSLARVPSDRPSAHAFAERLDDMIVRRGGHGRPGRIAALLERYGLSNGQVDTGALTPVGGQPTAVAVPQAVNTTVTDGVPAGFGGGVSYRVKLDRTSSAPLVSKAPPAPGSASASSQAPARGPSLPPDDGQVLGPLTFPNVVELITAGDVAGTAFVSKDGGDFVRLPSLPEFARFVTSPAFQWRIGAVSDAKRRGSLERGALLPVAHQIAVRRETGMLQLADGERQKRIYFVDGKPDYVASTNTRELLGEYLVSTGRCLRMEVEMALAVLDQHNGRIGDALVSLGVMRPVELFHALHDQVRHRYLEAFRWRKGEWAFVPLATSNEETLPVAPNHEELLREAACRTDLTALQEMLVPLSDERVLTNSSAPVPLARYAAPAAWMRILDVPTPTRVSELLERNVRSSQAEAEQVQRALYFGLSCEVLRLEGVKTTTSLEPPGQSP